MAAVGLVGVLALTGCAKDDPEPTTLVIGDSLTVGAEIGGLGDDGTMVIDAEEGRTTEEALAVAQAADLTAYERVIIAVGTNDYLDSTTDFDAKVNQMMAVLGSQLPVTWVNVDTGTEKLAPAADGVNASLASATERFDNLTVADWDAYINGRDDADDLRVGDGVHDSSEGYRVRAEWMASLADG